MIEEIQYDFFNHDGAVFRRPRGSRAGVTHVYSEKHRNWVEYKGANKTDPWMFGDRCSDPAD